MGIEGREAYRSHGQEFSRREPRALRSNASTVHELPKQTADLEERMSSRAEVCGETRDETRILIDRRQDVGQLGQLLPTDCFEQRKVFKGMKPGSGESPVLGSFGTHVHPSRHSSIILSMQSEVKAIKATTVSLAAVFFLLHVALQSSTVKILLHGYFLVIIFLWYAFC